VRASVRGEVNALNADRERLMREGLVGVAPHIKVSAELPVRVDNRDQSKVPVVATL
jgi:hypothetical protein